LDVEQQTCSQCSQPLGNFRRRLAYFAGLAAAYQEHEQPLKALATWQVVEVINPDFPQLHVHLGQAQAAAGRTDTAIANLRRALEQDPGQVAASLALGKIFHQLHHWKQAQAIYTQALAVTPDSPQLHFALGELWLELGRGRQALSHIQKVTQLDPRHGAAWLRLGQLYEASHKSRQAIQAYRRAATLLPPETVMRNQAQQGLEVLDPALPEMLASAWMELFRQMLGPILICILAVLLDAGLRPWWIPWTGWGALLLGTLGTFLWTSGASLPQNPVIQFLAGKQGLSSPTFRSSMTLLGGLFWLFSLGIVLLPLGQAYPELPSL
jgi:tetratricopeptide (TPR) repeat protein